MALPEPTNAPDLMFPDIFEQAAIILSPLDPLTPARAFESYPLTVDISTVDPAYALAGLVPPLELIIAAPSGRTTIRELPTVPRSVMLQADAGGDWLVTLREISHSRWYGNATVAVDGPAS